MSEHTLEIPDDARVHAVGAAAVAFLIGAVFIFGVGFAQIPAVHNAAHYTRHSIPFPCH